MIIIDCFMISVMSNEIFIVYHEVLCDKREMTKHAWGGEMQKTGRLFRRLDKGFWLIWLAYIAMVVILARDVMRDPATLEGLSPMQQTCAAAFPYVGRFSALGQAVFWVGFGLEFTLFAILLALGHRVIRRCARGLVLVTEMIGILRAIGLIITGWALVEPLVSNLSLWALYSLGDAPWLGPVLLLDAPMLGFGLLTLTMAGATAQAVRLREEADLTI